MNNEIGNIIPERKSVTANFGYFYGSVAALVTGLSNIEPGLN